MSTFRDELGRVGQPGELAFLDEVGMDAVYGAMVHLRRGHQREITRRYNKLNAVVPLDIQVLSDSSLVVRFNWVSLKWRRIQSVNIVSCDATISAFTENEVDRAHSRYS